MSQINVTPLVDVMLVLLIIFMVTAPMMQQGVQVNLPKADTKALTPQETTVVVSIDKSGRQFINSSEVPGGDLKTKLAAMFATRSKKEVFLKADKDVPYGEVNPGVIVNAIQQGADLKIVSDNVLTVAEFAWVVKKDSPIKTLKDTNGHTIAFSTNGSSTHSVVRAFIDEFKLTAKPQPTGNPSATLTAVMTDQVDVGWAAPPFGLKEMEEGKIHLVARATDAALVRGQTIRVLVANADALVKRKEIIERFMKAYRESIDYLYSSNPQVMKDYAEFARVSEPLAKRVRDEFFPKSLVNPDQIHGLDTLIPEAVNLKFIPAPLTKDQVAELIQISPRK